MKRVRPVNPGLPNIAREEVDLRARSRDSRRDPGATAKISREELEAALTRSNSGMRAAVRPEDIQHARTQSGERVAVRPEQHDEKVSSDRPTARPAAIEVGASHESESDRLADQMYRAVQARGPAEPAPVRDLAPTVMQAPFAHVVPPPAMPVSDTIPDAIADTIPEGDFALHDEDDPAALRARRIRTIASLVMLTTVLAAIAWYAGRHVGVLLLH
jgi:hypothetical protein